MEINIAVSEVVTQTWIPSLTLGVSLKVGRTDKAKAFLQLKNIWNQRIQDYLSEREAGQRIYGNKMPEKIPRRGDTDGIRRFVLAIIFY